MAEPKVGLLLLTAEWFAQIGASEGSFQGLAEVLGGDAAWMERALEREPEVVNPGVLATPEQVDQALLVFREHDVERFKLVIATGDAVGGEEKLFGSPHAYVRLEMPVERFYERCIRTGMAQHWALVHGDVVDELLALAGIWRPLASEVSRNQRAGIAAFTRKYDKSPSQEGPSMI